MRDAHLIRERSSTATGQVLAYGMRSLVVGTLVCASFCGGRWVERRAQALGPASAAPGKPQRAAPGSGPNEAATPFAAQTPAMPAFSARNPSAMGPGADGDVDVGSPSAVAPASLGAAAPGVHGDDGLSGVQRQAAKPGEYTLHLATLASRAEAKALASQLQRRGYVANLYALGGSERRTGVRLGRFASAAEAEGVRLRLGRREVVGEVVVQGCADRLLERTHGRGH